MANLKLRYTVDVELFGVKADANKDTRRAYIQAVREQLLVGVHSGVKSISIDGKSVAAEQELASA